VLFNLRYKQILLHVLWTSSSACSGSEFTSETANPFLDILIGLLGQGMGPLLGQDNTTEITLTCIHVSSGVRTNDPSVQAVLKTASQLGPASWKSMNVV